jgi:hypothetical protein
MKLIRNAFGIAIAVASLAAACSSQTGSKAGSTGAAGIGSLNGSGGQGDTGSVGLTLTIGNGVHVNALSWTISNGTPPGYTGTVSIADDAGHEAQSVEFVAGGILAGTGYTVTLSGSDSNGDPCTGTSTTFSVTAGATTGATVLVTCTVPTDAAVATTVDTGSVFVDAGVVLVNQNPYVCPGITSLAISPAEVLPPETAALSSSSTSGSGGSETILWTTSCAGAVITNPTSANATFNCGGATGTCQVTLTVGLEGVAPGGVDAGQVCSGIAFTTMTENVSCESGGSTACFAPTPNSCSKDGGTVCVSFATDVNNCGACGKVCPSGDSCTAGVCGAPPPVACTSAPCGANTVQCQGNTGGVCSPTEAALVALDISKGATAGNDPATGCYTCLFNNGCIDDTVFGDTGKECGDLSGSFTNAASSSVNAASTCLATLSCVLTTGCGLTNGGLTNCLCGAGGGGPSACAAQTSESPFNGACDTQEETGLASNVPSTVIGKEYTDTTEPSGMANQVIACGLVGNHCPQCLQ